MNRPQGIMELADDTFATDVEKGDGLVLVDFWAPWCGPCRMVAPMIEELAEEYAGRVSFGKLNVDDAPATAGAYGIRSIPTIALFKDGVPVGGVVGVVAKERLSALIDEHLGEAEE